MKDIFWIRGNPSVPLAVVLCPPGGGDCTTSCSASRAKVLTLWFRFLSRRKPQFLASLRKPGLPSRWVCSSSLIRFPTLVFRRAPLSFAASLLEWRIVSATGNLSASIAGEASAERPSQRPARSSIWVGRPRRHWRPLQPLAARLFPTRRSRRTGFCATSRCREQHIDFIQPPPLPRRQQRLIGRIDASKTESQLIVSA